jgi:FdhE protein
MQWHVGQVSYILRGSSQGVAYRHVEGRADGVDAETCDACHSYLKIMDQIEHPTLDPMADDMTCLDLDMMLHGVGDGVNLFPAG